MSEMRDALSRLARVNQGLRAGPALPPRPQLAHRGCTVGSKTPPVAALTAPDNARHSTNSNGGASITPAAFSRTSADPGR